MILLPPICLRQSDGPGTFFQYMLYFRDGLEQVPPPSLNAVCGSTYKVSVNIVKLNKTATRQAKSTIDHIFCIRQLREKKIGVR